MERGTTHGDFGVDRDDAVGKCLENIGFEPGAQNLTRNRIDALFCQDALFYPEERDRRNVELVGIRAVRPCGDFGRESNRSAQRGNDIRVEQKHPSRSTGCEIRLCLAGSKAKLPASPVCASAARRLRGCLPGRWCKTGMVYNT